MAKRLLELTDLFRFAALSDARISPDGSTVAFVKRSSDLAKNSVRSEIWIVPTGGGPPETLATEGSHNSSPRWSPDGSRICFLSNRSGRSQFYLMNLRDRQAKAIATREDVVPPALWSPDGRSIAFGAMAKVGRPVPEYPGAPQGNCSETSDERTRPKVVSTLGYGQDPVKVFGDTWRHLFVMPAEPTPEDKVAETRQITFGRFNHRSPAWSPDSLSLAFCVNLDVPGSEREGHQHLYVYSLATGQAKRVLAEDHPVLAVGFLPDGRSLAFVGTEAVSMYDAPEFSLYVVGFDPGTLPLSWSSAANLTGGFEGSLKPLLMQGGDLSFTPDGKRAYITILRRGESHLWSVPVACPREAAKLSPGQSRRVDTVSVAKNGRISYLAQSPTRPAELFTLDGAGSETQLTDFNGPLVDEIELQEPEKTSFKAPDGWDIEGWLLRPHGYREGIRWPTILSIHGGPHWLYGYEFSFEHQFLATRGFAVLYLNPRGSDSYGRPFAKAVIGDWGGKDYIDLMTGVDKVVEAGIADPGRLGVMGWSYGGFMTCWVVTQTQRFKAAIAGACTTDQISAFGTADSGFEFTEISMGALPWEDPETYLAHSPVMHSARATTPLLLLHGEADFRCPIAQSEEMFTALRKQGKTAVMVRYPGGGHGLGQPQHLADRWERTVAWFEHYLQA